MTREELEKKKKEDLIFMIIGMEKEIEEKECRIYELRKQIDKSKFEDYIYKDYVETKELLEDETRKNSLNQIRINDLNELLDKYKNIVDRLGIKEVY